MNIQKRKYWLIGIIGIAIIFAMVSIVSGRSESRDTVLKKISDAIDNNDPSLLLSTMPEQVQSYPFAEDAAKQLIKEASSQKDLYLQVMDAENNEVANSVKEIRLRGKVPYTLVKSGKKYVLQPTAETFITLKDVADDVKLKVNGQDVTRDVFQQPFLPGTYEIMAIKEYPLTTVVDTDVVEAQKSGQEEVSFDLTGSRLDLSEKFRGAQIFFKGQDTGIKVGDKESKEFGPIADQDGKEIQLQMSFPWGDAKSSSYSEGMNFQVDEKWANEFFLQFMREYAQSSVKSSVQPFTVTTENFNRNQADYYSSNDREHYELQKTYFNKETKGIWSDKDGNTNMKLEGFVVFKRLQDERRKEQEEDQEFEIYCLYDEKEKKWKVDSINVEDWLVYLPRAEEESKYIITAEK